MKNPVKDKKILGRPRVDRGGFWRDRVRIIRVSFRDGYTPSSRNFCQGFRLVRNKGKTDEKSSN